MSIDDTRITKSHADLARLKETGFTLLDSSIMLRLFFVNSICWYFYFSGYAFADGATQHIEMITDSTSNYYVTSFIDGAGQKSLLVDTGSGYSTISQNTLEVLREQGSAVYLRKLQGIMADGSRKFVSVYRIQGLNIGGNCYVKDIEVAVFPNGGREILGLSALGKVSPFTFSTEPPRLSLSHCNPV